MSAINYIELAKAARAAAAECIAQARAADHDHKYWHDWVAVEALDEHRQRIAVIGNIDYRNLTGLSLGDMVRDCAPAQWHVIALQGRVRTQDDISAYYDWAIDSTELLRARDHHKPRPERSEYDAFKGLTGMSTLFDRLEGQQ